MADIEELEEKLDDLEHRFARYKSDLAKVIRNAESERDAAIAQLEKAEAVLKGAFHREGFITFLEDVNAYLAEKAKEGGWDD